MAKQVGDIKTTGTVAGVTFYKMDGQYYARKKSSLEGKRVKRDPRFRRTMEWARRLARGSQLASRVYRSLPREERVYAWFVELKSTAIRALKEGRSEEDVLQLLTTCLAARLPASATAPAVPITRTAPRDQRPPAATGQPHLFVDADGKLQAVSQESIVNSRESSRSTASVPKKYARSRYARSRWRPRQRATLVRSPALLLLSDQIGVPAIAVRKFHIYALPSPTGLPQQELPARETLRGEPSATRKNLSIPLNLCHLRSNPCNPWLFCAIRFNQRNQ